MGCHAVLLSQIQKACCERATLQVPTIFMSVRGHKSIKCLKYKSAFFKLCFAHMSKYLSNTDVGSDTSLARHAQPYEIQTQAGQLCFSLQARVMLVELLCPFLKNAIWRLQGALNFTSSLLTGQLNWFICGCEGSQHPDLSREK